MASKKTNKDSRKRTEERSSASWAPWLVIGLVAAVAAYAAYTGLRRADLPAAPLSPEIGAEQAYSLYQQQQAVILDVRSASDWNLYHITNSKSIPLAELAGRLNELPRNAPIVVVDDYFDLSPQGRDILLKAGFPRVTALTGGILQWVLRHYPLVGLYPT